MGAQYPRPRRGLLSRPTVDEVYAYRRHVDAAMAVLLEQSDPEIAGRTELGLHHEQQHQELLLTDVKLNLGSNPLRPAYREDLDDRRPGATGSRRSFSEFEGGVVAIGAHPGQEAFCFDNELPRHDVVLRPFALANTLVTNAEFLAFMEDGGLERPDLWLSDGWAGLAVDASASGHAGGSSAGAPLYWFREDEVWMEYRLSGARELDPHAPVTHVSFYSADAFARWSGMRLPTEQEWEHAAAGRAVRGNFADVGALHPLPAGTGANGSDGPRQLFGDVWEWTASPYVPYPGYRPLPGTLGEYNGKFMSNQLVLRGGSCATPRGHVRPSYRNFFYPGDRWQFTGIRLAHDL